MSNQVLLHLDPSDVAIVDKPESPLYDPDRASLKPNKELIDNILLVGRVIVPIEVQQNGGGKYEIVDGRQRYKAAIEVNKRLVKEGKNPILLPAVFSPEHEKPTAVMADSWSTFLRTDDTMIAKARKLQKFLAEGGDEEQAPTIFGCSKATIKNWKLLLSLPSKVQKAVDDGKVKAAALLEFKGLEEKAQVDLLAKMIAEGTTTGDQARERIRKVKAKEPAAHPRARAKSRVFIDRWFKALKKADKFKEIQAVLSFLLGHENAIDGGLKELSEPPKKEKKEKKSSKK